MKTRTTLTRLQVIAIIVVVILSTMSLIWAQTWAYYHKRSTQHEREIFRQNWSAEYRTQVDNLVAEAIAAGLPLCPEARPRGEQSPCANAPRQLFISVGGDPDRPCGLQVQRFSDDACDFVDCVYWSEPYCGPPPDELRLIR